MSNKRTYGVTSSTDQTKTLKKLSSLWDDESLISKTKKNLFLAGNTQDTSAGGLYSSGTRRGMLTNKGSTCKQLAP